MFNLKRLVTLLTSALTLGVGAVLVLSATAPGSAALRGVANNLAISAHAAGSGGGSGVVSITIDPQAKLTAKLAAGVSFTYTCSPVYDPITFEQLPMSTSLYVQVQQRQGKTIAHGSGFGNAPAVCNDFTVNHATVVVVPDFYPGFVSLPFKNGAALATVSAYSCATSIVSSPPFNPCDFGNAGPAAISIK